MVSELPVVGDRVKMINSDLEATITKQLGDGAQGRVYQAEYEGSQVALKWYKPKKATPRQRQIIEELLEMGAPCDRFLWPLDLAIAKQIEGFGYIMELRPPRFASLSALVSRRVEPNFKVVCTIGYQLAVSYRELHARGYCYRDINFDNIFFDPKAGDILICDNDNVGIDGESEADVIGTQRFMAPEIVRGEAQPSTKTDLFSLAVLLFYIFMLNHPLHGKLESQIRCFDLPAMQKIYGENPVFIFDPANKTNRPQPGEHDNALVSWPIYPEFLQELFIQAFTEGLTDANSRVRETQWQRAMIRLRNLIFYCPHCGRENFYDPDNSSSDAPGECWACERQLQLPYQLHLEGDYSELVLLNHDTKLYPHHIKREQRGDFSAPVAKVVQHPDNPSVWGLKNLTEQVWTINSASGTVNKVEPGKSVRLTAKVEIDFNDRQGTIEY